MLHHLKHVRRVRDDAPFVCFASLHHYEFTAMAIVKVLDVSLDRQIILLFWYPQRGDGAHFTKKLLREPYHCGAEMHLIMEEICDITLFA